VAPFNSLTDNLSSTELAQLWQNGNLVVTPDAAAMLTTLYGSPTIPITPISGENLVSTVWASGQFALLPFHQLTPDLKVIRLDGVAPIDLTFNPDAYPLRLTIGLTGSALPANNFRSLWQPPTSNWDAGKISHIAMTGVTGTGRAVGYQMEISGITFPGEEIAPLMNAVDIAHISHEIPFASDCPFPDPTGGTTFCAADRYLELLTSLGIDVVEMTGNHINDWGEPNVQHTFDLYEAVGMQWFGGGRDLTQAQQPLIREHNGNRIAFVGCNPVGPYYAWADVAYGGANPCPDYTTVLAQISQLRAEGYVVIATIQYWEDYSYYPTSQQRYDFRLFAEAGAAAVSGSQGHHAMGFGFHQGAFIHYGLGDLIFDQPQMLGTEQTFIDVYTVYDGRLLNVDLWTGMIEYLSRPRPMTPDERQQLLQSTFQASDWEQ
jgi:poly-gamma-glutamate synthesis protein (capsule biosynthesis protein)